MGRTIAAVLSLGVGLLATGVHADVYKCLDHGRTSYQDRPCPAGARTAMHQMSGPAVAASAAARARLEAQAGASAEAEAELRRLAARLHLVTQQAHRLDDQYRRELAALHRQLDGLAGDERRRRQAAFDAQWRDRLGGPAQQRGSLLQQIRQVCPNGARLERDPPTCLP